MLMSGGTNSHLDRYSAERYSRMHRISSLHEVERSKLQKTQKTKNVLTVVRVSSRIQYYKNYNK